jgi:hypothetical protein
MTRADLIRPRMPRTSRRQHRGQIRGLRGLDRGCLHFPDYAGTGARRVETHLRDDTRRHRY